MILYNTKSFFFALGGFKLSLKFKVKKQKKDFNFNKIY